MLVFGVIYGNNKVERPHRERANESKIDQELQELSYSAQDRTMEQNN